MFRKYPLLALSALITTLISCLPVGVNAFELFPRPEEQYTVRRGDTLYGIAGNFYSDPSMWPFLWNQNPQILIKDKGGAAAREPLAPGTKVNLYASRRQQTAIGETYNPPTGIPDDVRFLVDKVPRKGIPYDRKYFKYNLTSRPIKIWGYIVAAPDQTKDHYLERDLVYIRFRPSKKQVVLVGDRFGIYRDQGPLNHPLNPEVPVGFVTELVGEVEITNTGHELATAIILDSYVEISRADKICLYTPREREIVPTKTHRMLTGTVLLSASRDRFYRDANNQENDIVFVNRGECDGMTEGLLLNFYRPSHPVADPYTHEYVSTPDRYVGEGLVLKAFEKNSTVLITRGREEVMAGDVIKSVSD